LLASHYAAWRSRRCIAVSTSLREHLWTASLRGKTDVIRDSVDPTLFRPLPRREARERLGVPHDDVVVIFPHVASEPRKRLWLAQAAVEVLRASIPTARLWVVNDQPPDAMPWHYAAADAMVVTSVFEGGPTATKEALACGVPVVSVPVGDLDLFREVPAGAAIHAAADPHALADALRTVLSRARPERVSLLPEALTLPHAARALTVLYERVVSGHGRQRQAAAGVAA
jgi:glycosyltransferase involved in cell wall biosynthesis